MAKEVKKRSFWKIFFLFFGIIFLVAGGALLTTVAVAPETAEKIVYSAKVKAEEQISKVTETVTGEYPSIYYGGSGGMREMDVTENRHFIHVLSYDKVEGIPKTLAAHNGRGGDVILPWKEGQHFNIVGGEDAGTWVVVETRDVPKFGTTDPVVGIQGTLLLQTCHWGEPVVRFVGAVPLEIYENGWEPSASPSSSDEETQTAELVVEN